MSVRSRNPKRRQAAALHMDLTVAAPQTSFTGPSPSFRLHHCRPIGEFPRVSADPNHRDSNYASVATLRLGSLI
jgi:hypothetical protein